MNRFRSLARTTVAAVLGLAALSSAGTASAAAPAQWVMGYYVGYLENDLPPAKIDWADLTHIVMSPMTVNADGTVNTDFDASTGNGPALAKNISTRAHAAGKKALLMMGGAGNGSQIASAVAGHRAAFVKNLLSTMKSLGYDGIDLDWEDNVDWADFQAFATALRKAAPTAILTMPVGPINLNYQTVDPHMAAIAKQLDRVDIMSYYPATAFSGSGWDSWFGSALKGEKESTPITIDTSLAAFAAAGVPKAKLGMGISFYAICYTGGITGPNQSTGNGISVTIQGGDNDFMLSELYGKQNEYFQIYNKWNAAALEPYMTLPTANGRGCRYVTYENERSILAKGQFSRAQGYGGIVIWTLNEGYVGSHPNPNFLMDALYKGFVKPATVTPVAVSILQPTPSMKPNVSLRFSALVTGNVNQTATWSIPKAACGAIDKNGLYTAPATQKTCAVKATSVADPTKSATVNVTVSKGP